MSMQTKPTSCSSTDWRRLVFSKVIPTLGGGHEVISCQYGSNTRSESPQ